MPEKNQVEITTDMRTNSVILFGQTVTLPDDRIPIYFRTGEGTIGLLILNSETATSANKAILGWLMK